MSRNLPPFGANASFLYKIENFANAVGSSSDPHLRGLGCWLMKLVGEIEATDAKSWEEFDDRREAMMRPDADAIPDSDRENALWFL